MNDTFDRELMSDFINRFSAFEQQTMRMRIDTDLDCFKKLFSAFADVDKKLQEIMLTTAPDYNIFNVLNISHYETKVHTPYLSHLLDPVASHKQDRLFFDSFIDTIFEKGYSSTISNIRIFEEFVCGRGRIDILILYQLDKQKRALVIENKIYHHDEENQLVRYYEYLTLIMFFLFLWFPN